MNMEDVGKYKMVREGGLGFCEQKRGLIEVSGREAIQFLNGLITNDVVKLEDNAQMSAAFPNANGRLIAVVRVIRQGDKFLFETEAATHESVFKNLFRFTFAGDFFVEDSSENFNYFEILGSEFQIPNFQSLIYQKTGGADYFVPKTAVKNFRGELEKAGAVEISNELYEVLRIENGILKYGVDMDETTIVPEIGLPELISYNKGCYIGQEIIARIHFRGHIAKKLTGLIFEENAKIKLNDELKSLEGKNAGRITSVTFSPKLEKDIALAYVRYDYLAEGTELKVNDFTAKVNDLPFIK
ncbi:glycine cleavage T C-terminal barrel domain-containing protein [soil metagenome]|jgi:aminomethyltransferase